MDLKHPFIAYPRLAIYYGIFWVVAIVSTVFIAAYVNGMQIQMAFVEVSGFLLSYALIGSAVWYVIRFSTLEDHALGRILLTHLIAASIIVFLWLYMGFVLIKLADPDAGGRMRGVLVNRIYVGYLLYVVYVVFFYALNYYQEFKKKSKNEKKLQILVKEAELHALKSQINPHFLFNCLNSISALTITDPGKAQEMVLNLSRLMRYSLKHEQKELVLFREELEVNKLYLSIEQVRFGAKLNPVFIIEEACYDAVIPNMILQPLYENAIKHGVYEATETVDVVSRARLVNGVLEISIRNAFDQSVQTKKGESIGLSNIRERLQVIYGDPLLMRIQNKNNEFTVELSIPQTV